MVLKVCSAETKRCATSSHKILGYISVMSALTLTYLLYERRTESHEQLFFARELGTADEGECGGRWNQLLCYP